MKPNYVYYNLQNNINSFYSSIKKQKFNELTKEEILRLKKESFELNNFFNYTINSNKRNISYVRVMEKIKSNTKKYNLDTGAKQLILLMFSVDPNFEALKIYGEFNKIEDIKKKMQSTFGVYDLNLIKIENLFLKYFCSKETKNKINEEIEKRVFK